MNRAIIRVFIVMTLLFAVLLGVSSYRSVLWPILDPTGFADDQSKNRRALLEEEIHPRGQILADDDSKLAESRNEGTQELPRYVRQYPTGDLFAHPIGYSFLNCGRSELESFYNSQLTGAGNELSSILDAILGSAEQGDDLITNLDPAAQKIATDALTAAAGDSGGAVVALEPSTGKVRVMASIPGFDPNTVPEQCSELNTETGSPIVNRPTQSLYPPGSTMKVVTATAALDSGEFTPDSTLDGSSPKDIGGVPLSNFAGEQFGTIDLTTALTHSVNTVWAQVAEQLGAKTMFQYMDRYGFDKKPPLDFPDGELGTSGVYSKGKTIEDTDAVDIGRVGIGQERLLVTPLQMAEVAATVANNGVRVAPRLGAEIRAADGRVKETFEPQEVTRVMKPSTADALTSMMTDVVNDGTGGAAALESIQVAGKTGTAEVDSGSTNQVWFIGFAPADDPKMAVAVTVERSDATGGDVAAPIAKQVLQQLLGE
ncbi:MAG: penicillin-binding protein [Thermoleophilaceae bacterium]|nr:penicillin-binding protein [Thermoleophilaceae bacterium]